MTQLRNGLALGLMASLLAACGGGSSADTTPKTKITAVHVFGDSLADSGTFGIKFTVQGADSLIYPERIAKAYGATLCPVLTSPDGGATFAPNTTSGCTNWAVGGGRINIPTAPTSPYAIRQQLANAAAAHSYTAADMVVVDGGGNDAADLVGAYLKASTDSGASFVALASTLLDGATVAGALGGANPLPTLGGLYMKALADAFFASVKTNTLDKGATNVVVVNMPGITNTPRFQMVLASISAAYGGGAAGDAAKAASLAVFDGWVKGFNAELAAKVAGNSSVVLYDFYTAFNLEVSTPAQFGLQNITTPACPITGVGTDGLPTYTFATCTDTNLSATTPPQGATGGANWWKTYGFSDGFHPTPYGHQLIYQRIALDLAASGRL